MTVSFASYLERQNLEDRVEWSPEALRAADRPASQSTPERTEPREMTKPEPKPIGAARLADVLPVATTVRRSEVETLYRLRLATTRPSGVLDVMG